MNKKRLRLGPVTVNVEFRDLRCVLQGLRVALTRARRDGPVDPDRIPDGWELRQDEWATDWPSEWLHPTGYWVSIWRVSSATGEHISIRPGTDGWRVRYKPKNSWMGGPTIARGLEYEEALDVAIDVATRVNDGADQGSLRRCHRGGDSGAD